MMMIASTGAYCTPSGRESQLERVKLPVNASDTLDGVHKHKIFLTYGHSTSEGFPANSKSDSAFTGDHLHGSSPM
jgi:hypothetical protein